MNTAERLVKESEEIMEQNVLGPIILQKYAARGYKPTTDEDMQVVLTVASHVRNELAMENGEMSKAASAKEVDDVEINLDEVDPVVKEAAAIATWAALEAMAEQSSTETAEVNKG